MNNDQDQDRGEFAPCPLPDHEQRIQDGDLMNVMRQAVWDTATVVPKAQPEQGPVAWESLLGAIARGWCYEKNANKEMDADLVYAIATEIKALYTTPPQRTWQGLTDEDCDEFERWVEFKEEGSGRIPMGKLARYIEAKLKEKNNG